VLRSRRAEVTGAGGGPAGVGDGDGAIDDEAGVLGAAAGADAVDTVEFDADGLDVAGAGGVPVEAGGVVDVAGEEANGADAAVIGGMDDLGADAGDDEALVDDGEAFAGGATVEDGGEGAGEATPTGGTFDAAGRDVVTDDTPAPGSGPSTVGGAETVMAGVDALSSVDASLEGRDATVGHVMIVGP